MTTLYGDRVKLVKPLGNLELGITGRCTADVPGHGFAIWFDYPPFSETSKWLVFTEECKHCFEVIEEDG